MSRRARSRRGEDQPAPWWEGEAPVIPGGRSRPRTALPTLEPAASARTVPPVPPSRPPRERAPIRRDEPTPGRQSRPAGARRPAGTGYGDLRAVPAAGAAPTPGGLAPVIPLRPRRPDAAASGFAHLGLTAPTRPPAVDLRDTLQLSRVPTGRQRAAQPAVPPAVPRRRAAAAGRVVGTAVGTAVALAIAWLVLVTLRFDPPVARRSLDVARLDAAVAAGRSADHVLSVATWVGYVAATLVLGGLAFRTVIRRVPRRLPVRAAAGAGVGAAVTSVALRAVEVSGGGAEAAVDRDVLAHVLTSPFGNAMALRAAGLLLVVASLGGRPGGGLRRAGRWVTGAGRLAGAGVVLASYLVVGHAQATDPAIVQVTALGVHVVAAAAWFGGVAVLAYDLCPGGRRPARLPARAVARFSRLAEAMVVLVIASGAVLAEGQGLFARPPWETGYGQAFVAKLGFVAAVLVIGGYNRLRVVPAVAARDEAAARARLRTTCAVEAVVIGVGVLLMTAAMTSGGF